MRITATPLYKNERRNRVHVLSRDVTFVQLPVRDYLRVHNLQ